MGTCPAQATVVAFVHQSLSPEDHAAIEAHVDECNGCRRRFARATPEYEMGDEPTTPQWDEPRELEASVRVGRLVVLRTIARGGIGTVALAYDPELDRRVALKVLRPELWHVIGPAAREQLQREAMVMGRLAHPNIVTVYDVGSWCDQVFVAMEFVDGPTLNEWSQAEMRSWREVLDRCVAAGRGLAAAHAAGIVHRDVKPANVMCGLDGRVRVTDFGVAALLGDGRSVGNDEVVSGTPGYMSPEQMEGRPVDSRSDQFSFCVMTWEAMTGTRPFRGDTLPAIWEAVRSRVLVPVAPSRMPSAVRRVLLRGLALEPADRFASMDELLAALSTQAGKRSRRWVAAAAVVAGLAAAAGVGALVGGQTRDDETCAGASDHLRGVWDAERRDAVERVFGAAPLSDRGGAFRRFSEVLDARTSRWVEARNETCRDTRVTQEQSEAVHLARMECLDDQLRNIESLVAAVADGGPSLFRALETAHALPQADGCSASAARTRGAPARFVGDLAATARATEVDRLTARARTAISLFDLEAAREALSNAMRVSQGLDDDVRQARILFERGRAEEAAHEFDSAEESFTTAAKVAATAGADLIVADASARMMYLVGVHQQRPGDAAAWAAAADLQLARGVGDDWLRAFLEETRGKMAYHRHEFEVARGHADRAIELYRRSVGNDGPGVLSALTLQAMTLDNLGDRDAARELGVRTLAIAEAAYGPDHPRVADSATMLARWSVEAGDLTGARSGFERALSIRERALGAEHPLVAESLGDLGVVADEQGDHQAAEINFRRWLAVEEKTDPDAPTLAPPLVNLATVLRKTERHEEARAHLERAIAIYERVRGRDFAGLVEPLLELANVEEAVGGCAASRPVLDRALAIAERGAPDDPTVSYLLIPLAMCEIKAGRWQDGLEMARRAGAIRRVAKLPPGLLAEAVFAEAHALLAGGLTRDARELASDARRDASAELAVEIDTFLRAPKPSRRRRL